MTKNMNTRKPASLKVVPSSEDQSTSAETFNSAEALVSYILGIVEDWQEKDGKIISIAIAAQEWAKLRDDIPIENSLFAAIEYQSEGLYHSSELTAGIRRLAQLLNVPVKDAEVAHG
jgi:hypothetical protein